MTVPADNIFNKRFLKNCIAQPFASHISAKEVKGETVWIIDHFLERKVVCYNNNGI